ERGPAVMAQRQRPAAKFRRERQFFPISIGTHQAVLGQPRGSLAARAELVLMGGVAIEWNFLTAQMCKGRLLPVIVVEVREHDGSDEPPRGADFGQSGGQSPRTQAGVDQ